MQRLLNFYSWSADEVRDDLRAYVAAAIGDVGGVLIPGETGFLKKGTKSAGLPFGWVAADEVYGQNGPLRDWLEERHVSYVLAGPKSFPVATAAGLVRADHLAALAPAAGHTSATSGRALPALVTMATPPPSPGPAVPLPAQAHEPAAADEVLTGCASSGVSARLAEAVSPGSGTDRPTSAGLCPLASR